LFSIISAVRNRGWVLHNPTKTPLWRGLLPLI